MLIKSYLRRTCKFGDIENYVGGSWRAVGSQSLGVGFGCFEEVRGGIWSWAFEGVFYMS